MAPWRPAKQRRCCLGWQGNWWGKHEQADEEEKEDASREVHSQHRITHRNVCFSALHLTAICRGGGRSARPAWCSPAGTTNRWPFGGHIVSWTGNSQSIRAPLQHYLPMLINNKSKQRTTWTRLTKNNSSRQNGQRRISGSSIRL